MKRGLSIILLFVFAAGTSAQVSKSGTGVTPASASSDAAPKPVSSNLAPSQIFSRARPSVVVIIASDQNDKREALGSGFIAEHGKIVTNHHVVEGMNHAYVVFSDGATKPVSRVAADSAQQDLIVLAVETGNRSAVKFGDEMSLQQGDSVYALGAPEGLQLTFTNGIVSSFRNANTQFLIQTTAPIAHGSSGGPLFDRTGRVVGVTTSMLSDAPGIYFSVGIGDLKRLLKTPQGIALSFEEWATHQAKHESQHVEAPTGLGNHEQRDQWIRLQGSLRLMEKLSEAHGFSTSTNGSERNVFESGFIIVPEHPCGGDIAYEFDKVLLLNLANADAASIQVDASLVKFEVSLFYEAANFKQLQNGKEKSGAVSVTFDSGQNALEFARLLNEAVAICRERKSQDQSF